MTANPRWFYLIARSQRCIGRACELETQRGLGISAVQLGALHAVDSADGLSLKTLGDLLDLAPSAVSGLTDRLEREGWVERRADPRDGRASRLYLTKRGAKAVAASKPVLAAMNERVTEGFSAAELAVVERFLNTQIDRFRNPEQDP